MSEKVENDLNHGMPWIWRVLCPAGSCACLTGAVTGNTYISVAGLLVTGPCLIWYSVSKRRLCRRVQRLVV